MCKVKSLDLAPRFRVYRGSVRISELAERIGVPTSTVRYYERIGLLAVPARTGSGYRDYGEDAATRLLFVARARRLGLGCEAIADLLQMWDGVNCGAAQDRVGRLIDEKRADIARRIGELQEFAAQLENVKDLLEADPPPATCQACPAASPRDASRSSRWSS